LLELSDRRVRDTSEDVGKPGLRIDVIELGARDQRCHEGGAISAAIGAGEEPCLSAEGNAPFILPMSAMKLRLFIAGILILARGFPFAVLKNERQAGF